MKKIVFILFILGSSHMHGQNLVPNPDFEDTINFRWLVSKGSPDFYYPNGLGWTGVYAYDTISKSIPNKNFFVRSKKNASGKQKPHTGNGYSGLIIYGYMEPVKPYRVESMTIKLNEPLKKDSTYKVECYASLAEGSTQIVDMLNIYFSDSIVVIPEKKSNSYFSDLPKNDFNFSTSLKQNDNGFIKNRKKWIKLSGSYKAVGGEQFMRVNTAQLNTNHKKIRAKFWFLLATIGCSDMAYYFLDDFSVIDQHDNNKARPSFGR